MKVTVEIEEIAGEEVSEIVRECLRDEIARHIKKDQKLKELLEQRVALAIANISGGK